jgi:cell division protease FtsH
VRHLVDDAYARAGDLLSRHRPTLEAMSTQLLERETLEEGELAALLRSPG